MKKYKCFDEFDFSVIDKVPSDLKDNDIFEYVMNFTNTYKKYQSADKSLRELECLKIMFPKSFRKILKSDYSIGSINILPVGIGSTTTVGGVGYYANFKDLFKLREKLSEENAILLDEVISFWQVNDTREKFFKDNLVDNVLGRFVETDFPAIVTTRLSGMYLDYNKLLDNGIDGLKEIILKNNIQNEFTTSMVGALDLLTRIIEDQIIEIENNKELVGLKWEKMTKALNNIKHNKPQSFIEALELSWYFSLVSGVINYGRMDDYLGDYLVKDLDNMKITYQEALDYVSSLFILMEQRRTLANSRVIIGGLGRRNEKNADVFCKLAIEAIIKNQEIEPQLTLRYYQGMSEEVYDLALLAIEKGITFPIIYNDDVNVDAVKNAMGVDYETALKYVPLGCGEINLSGCGVSTPNTCINLLKVLTIALNNGIDPNDNIDKSNGVILKDVSELLSFEDVYNQYKKLTSNYIHMLADKQKISYQVLGDDISYLYTSILVDDCIKRAKPILSGGVRHLGGTNETYGNISTSDSLYCLKKVVFEDLKYSLSEVIEATKNNFVGYENIRSELIKVKTYGNDDQEADDFAADMHNFICHEMRSQAKRVGLDYYLVVIINNQIGTQWGLDTAASTNGRLSNTYMSNGNNPQSGNDKSGPTAMLNSIAKLDPSIHAGAVQNMKFSKELFKNKTLIKNLLDVYFENGGAQIMITVVGKDELEKAYNNPSDYPNLIVRVGGFSARFIDLNRKVQQEIMERTLN